MRIVVPGEMPGMNEIVGAAKLAARARYGGGYTKEKRECTGLVERAALGVQPVPAASVVCHWYCKDKRRNPDNIAAGVKFALDGLVHAGVLKNDGWSEVLELRHTFHVDKHNPRLEIELMEVGA